jgi:hypothetical protein
VRQPAAVPCAAVRGTADAAVWRRAIQRTPDLTSSPPSPPQDRTRMPPAWRRAQRERRTTRRRRERLHRASARRPCSAVQFRRACPPTRKKNAPGRRWVSCGRMIDPNFAGQPLNRARTIRRRARRLHAARPTWRTMLSLSAGSRRRRTCTARISAQPADKATSTPPVSDTVEPAAARFYSCL